MINSLKMYNTEIVQISNRLRVVARFTNIIQHIYISKVHRSTEFHNSTLCSASVALYTEF
jgi:hypothetical protein